MLFRNTNITCLFLSKFQRTTRKLFLYGFKIVNDFNDLRKIFPQRASLDLYLESLYRKITPVTLSILSTALGLLPFTLHGQREAFWFALAVGAIGGLLFSLVVILFFIPLFFVKKG